MTKHLTTVFGLVASQAPLNQIAHGLNQYKETLKRFLEKLQTERRDLLAFKVRHDEFDRLAQELRRLQDSLALVKEEKEEAEREAAELRGNVVYLEEALAQARSDAADSVMQQTMPQSVDHAELSRYKELYNSAMEENASLREYADKLAERPPPDQALVQENDRLRQQLVRLPSPLLPPHIIYTLRDPRPLSSCLSAFCLTIPQKDALKVIERIRGVAPSSSSSTSTPSPASSPILVQREQGSPVAPISVPSSSASLHPPQSAFSPGSSPDEHPVRGYALLGRSRMGGDPSSPTPASPTTSPPPTLNNLPLPSSGTATPPLTTSGFVPASSAAKPKHGSAPRAQLARNRTGQRDLLADMGTKLPQAPHEAASPRPGAPIPQHQSGGAPPHLDKARQERIDSTRRKFEVSYVRFPLSHPSSIFPEAEPRSSPVAP